MKPMPSQPAEVGSLVALVQASRPQWTVEVAVGGDAARNWWIVFSDGPNEVVAEWRFEKGFGLYPANAEGYGERPSVFRGDPREAASHIIAALPEERFTADLVQPLL